VTNDTEMKSTAYGIIYFIVHLLFRTYKYGDCIAASSQCTNELRKCDLPY